MSERINIWELRSKAHAIATRQLDDRILTPGEASDVLALVDAVEAAKRVAEERTGHELGGEHPLYVKLCSLDERLDRFDFGEQA